MPDAPTGQQGHMVAVTLVLNFWGAVLTFADIYRNRSERVPPTVNIPELIRN